MEMFKIYKDILSESDFALLKDVIKKQANFVNLQQGEEFKSLQGYKFLPGFSPEAAEFAYNNFQPKKGDVFLMSFPKTGTNWTMEVLQQILYQDEQESKLYNGLPIPARIIEFSPSEKLGLLDKLHLKRRLLSSHLPSELVNVEKIEQAGAKVVYVLRNPKDQMVSWYNFFQAIPQSKFEPMKSMVHTGWENFFKFAVEGAFSMCSKPGEWYPENILSWYQHLGKKQVYFVYFEDMKKDLKRQIELLAQFLEVPLTEERATKIAETCTFDNMKKSKTTGTSIESKMQATNMRKGSVGGWKDYFTVSQSELVDAIMEEKLKDTNIKFTYQL